jgi:hypothetical protein
VLDHLDKDGWACADWGVRDPGAGRSGLAGSLDRHFGLPSWRELVKPFWRRVCEEVHAAGREGDLPGEEDARRPGVLPSPQCT